MPTAVPVKPLGRQVAAFGDNTAGDVAGQGNAGAHGGPGADAMVDGVSPLLAEGLDAAVEALRLRPADRSLTDYLALLQRRHALPSPDPAVLDLLRLACTDPALRPVWLQAHDDALPVLTQLLAHRTGSDAQDLHVQVHAAVVNSALRIGAENFALQHPGESPSAAPNLLAALRIASQGLPY